MTQMMDRRIAWRFLDFWKDILMHHRKFTPFQNLVFLTFLVVVILGVFRNLWAVGIAVTYGVSIYLSVAVSGIVLGRYTYLASDSVLLFVNRAEQIWTNFLHQQDDKIFSDLRKEESETCSGADDTHMIDDEFYDAPDKTPTHNRKFSLTPKKSPASEKVEASNVAPEVDLILQYIHRDFIQSWYNLFSSDEEGLMEAEILLSNIFNDLKMRLSKLDRFEIAHIIMLMFSSHINKVKQAQMTLKSQRRRRRSSVKLKTNTEASTTGQSKPATVFYTTVEECFGAKAELHPAVRNKELEQMYQKSVVEIILLNVFEDNLTETKAVIYALKEILMCNVLQSVLSLLSDSTFLHERVIQITSNEEPFQCKESVPQVLVTENDEAEKTCVVTKETSDCNASSCNSVSKENLGSCCEALAEEAKDQRNTNKPDDAVLPADNETNHETKWVEDVKTFSVTTGLCNECNRLCSKDKDKISPRPHSCSLGTTPVFFDADRLSIDSFESFGSLPRDGSPIFEIEKRDSQPFTPALDNIPDINIDNALHDSVFVDANTDSAKAIDDQAGIKQQTSTEESPDEGKIEVAAEPAEIESENKNVSDTFFSFIPNPLNAIPILRKKSTSGLNYVRNRSSPSLETADEKSETLDIRKSISSEEILKDSLSPTTPDFPYPSDGPSVFQDVRIMSTETAKEPNGSSVYTLYVLEYEALYQTEEDLVHRTGVVKRRFREFVNLQSRLEDNSQYKESLRDIKGPKKLIPSLPFGNMGRETLDNRKKLLESFLVALIKRPDICNGAELKQFLGYSGDGHIAFVRKNPESSARIDQRLVKTMSGVFDKIVDTLPSLPPQLPRIMASSSSSSKDEREEEDPGKSLEDLDHLELDVGIEKDQQMYQKVDSALDKFMEKKLFVLVMGEEEQSGDTTLGVSVLGWQDKQRSVSPIPRLSVSPPRTPPPTSSTKSTPQTPTKSAPGFEVQCLEASGECPLISAILDILAELLSGEHSWFCRENVTHSTKVILGKGLDKFVESKVELLTSEPMNAFYLRTLRDTLWPGSELAVQPRPTFVESKVELLTSEAMNAFYLRKLRDTLWPGGELSVQPRPAYTDGQKEILKKQAVRCLGDFLPDVLKLLLGEEDFSHLVGEVFETIQYEKLNRHFWYSVIDILLEKLFPEVNSAELQRKLSVTPEH